MTTTVAPTKVCARCATRKPWTDFYAKVKWPDGTMRQPHSRCKACISELNALPERREYQRVYSRDVRRPRVRANPEAIERERERQRFSYRARYGVTRIARSRQGGLLPAEPFAAWLNSLGLDTVRELPASQEALRKIRNGRQPYVSIDTVDRCCLHMDIHIDQLYPLEDAA